MDSRIPSTPDTLSHSKYTYRERELAGILNNIWINRHYITEEDFYPLNELANQSISSENEVRIVPKNLFT